MAIIRNPNEPFQRLADTLVKARMPFDRDMLLNLSFFLGEQYATWADDIDSPRNRPRDPWEKTGVRPVVNKIAHFVQQSHAAVLQTKPTVDVLPATDDLHDSVMAPIALAWLTWLTEPQVEHFDMKLAEAAMWAIITGNGYLKWTFDPVAKRPTISVPSPLDVYIDPYCTTINEARYILHRRFMDPEQVYDRWGVQVKQRDMANVDPVKAELMRALGYAPVQSGVVVHELWHTPSRRYEKGLYTVWAGNEQLVAPDKHPYEHQKLPFTQLGMIQRPGAPYYISPVSNGRSPQVELNLYHQQRIKIRENFANPKWAIDAETVATMNSLPDDSPAQVLVGDFQNGTKLPVILQPAAMADNNEGAWLVEEMMNIWGLHETMQGQAPGRVEAARALEILKDSDMSRFNEINRTIDNSISEGFWQCIQLAQQFMKGEQVLQTYSRDGMPEVQRFMAEDFKDGMRVRVTRGTGLPRGRSERQDFLLRMWDSQVIQDPALMAELLELPMPNFVSHEARDIKLSRSENYTLAAGKPITPNSWDNHVIHIREHDSYRKSQDYAQLPDSFKTMFEAHVQMHKELMVTVAQEQLLQQAEVQNVLVASAAGISEGAAPEQTEDPTAPEQTPPPA